MRALAIGLALVLAGCAAAEAQEPGGVFVRVENHSGAPILMYATPVKAPVVRLEHGQGACVELVRSGMGSFYAVTEGTTQGVVSPIIDYDEGTAWLWIVGSPGALGGLRPMETPCAGDAAAPEPERSA